MKNYGAQFTKKFRFFCILLIVCLGVLGCGSENSPTPEIEESVPLPPYINIESNFEVTQTGMLQLTPTITLDKTATISEVSWTLLEGDNIKLTTDESGVATLLAPQVEQDTTVKIEIRITDSLGQQAAKQINVTILKGMYSSSDIRLALEFPFNKFNTLFYGNFDDSPDIELIIGRNEDNFKGLEVYRFEKDNSLKHVTTINTGNLNHFVKVVDSKTDSSMLLASESFEGALEHFVIENLGVNARFIPIEFDGFELSTKLLFQNVFTGEGIELQVATNSFGYIAYDYACKLEKVSLTAYLCSLKNIFQTAVKEPMLDVSNSYVLVDLDLDGRSEMIEHSYRYIEGNEDFVFESYHSIYTQTSDFEFDFSFELVNDAQFDLGFEDFNGDGLLDSMIRKDNQVFIAEQIEGEEISFSSLIEVDGSVCDVYARYRYYGYVNGSKSKHLICYRRHIIGFNKEFGRYVLDKSNLPDSISEVRDVIDVNGDQMVDLLAFNGDDMLFYIGSNNGFSDIQSFKSYNIRERERVNYDIDFDGDLDAFYIAGDDLNAKLIINLNMLRVEK